MPRNGRRAARFAPALGACLAVGLLAVTGCRSGGSTQVVDEYPAPAPPAGYGPAAAPGMVYGAAPGTPYGAGPGTYAPSMAGPPGSIEACGYQQVAGSIPRELDKMSLPVYRVEPPDILLIEAVNNLRHGHAPLRAGDPLSIRVARTIPVDQTDDPVTASFKQIAGVYVVQSDGTVDRGPEYGRVRIAGYTVEQANHAVRDHLAAGPLRDPLVSVQLNEPRTRQHIAGEHLVRPDGTVSLGIYGSVHVAGLTLDEVRWRIQQHLARYVHQPEVSVDVLAYNSKVYYVVTDGAGAGEQVFRFPCTGNETVLDAIAQINGLPVVACKKQIWVARPRPAGQAEDQLLDVDWDAIARGADTTTNYQILPGDRVYVKADDLVTFDTYIAKIVSPFERLFGFVLLGHGTVREIQYGHRRNGTNNGGFGF